MLADKGLHELIATMRQLRVVVPLHREELPRSLFEAGAIGLTVMATDALRCRHVV